MGKKIARCPLPSCQGEVELIENVWDGMEVFFIRCKECLLETREFRSKKRLIEYWNYKK